MERNGTLLNRKYRTLLISTLAMTASMYLANIVDGIMVGQMLGTQSFSAINLTSSISFLKNILIALFTYGGNTLMVMYKGRRDNQTANNIFTLTYIVGVGLAILSALIGIALAKPTATVLTNGGVHYDNVLSYLVPLWITTPLVAIVNITAAFSRTDGLNKLATALPIVSNVINLCFDYIYMGIFKWGVAGAGWATVTGYVLGGLLIVIYFKSKKRGVKFSKKCFESFRVLKDMVTTGAPSSLIYVCNFLRLFILNQIILTTTGVVGLKISSVAFSVNSLAFIFVEGASMTMLPIMGALRGENDVKGQRILFKYSMLVTFSLCMIVLVVSEIFPAPFAAIFGLTDPEIVPMFNKVFRIFSLNIPILSVIYVLRTYFQAMKESFLANILVVLDGFATIVPIMYILSSYGIYVMWSAFIVSKLVTLVLILVIMKIYYKKHNKTFLADKEEGVVMDFTIDNKTDAAVNASEEVISFLRANGCNDKSTVAIGVAVEEICKNISMYASSKTSDKIDICLRVFTDKITLRIRDNGPDFNPTTFIDDSGEMITGLKLVRALTDNIEHIRVIGFNNTFITVEF